MTCHTPATDISTPAMIIIMIGNKKTEGEVALSVIKCFRSLVKFYENLFFSNLTVDTHTVVPETYCS
jgi:hypothetical protein